jgi:ABC-type amino acid transport substrate-binding protein
MNTHPRLCLLILAPTAALLVGAVAQSLRAGTPAPQAASANALKTRSRSLPDYLVQIGAVTQPAKRQALWAALRRAWPATFGTHDSNPDLSGGRVIRMDVYAENGELTRICFCRGNQVYTFDLHTGKITPISMAKVLPVINAITYAHGKEPMGPGFILWSDGSPEAYIGETTN